MGHPALELGLALSRPLLFRFERLAGERDAVEGRAAPGLLLAQGWQGGGRQRLQARGLSLSAGALSDFDQVGVEPPARLGERRLVVAPGDETGERLLAADGRGELAVAVRLAGLTLEAVDLGVDLLQHILDAGEIVVRPFQPKLGFVAARMEAGDAGGLLQNEPPRLRPRRNDLADLSLAHQRGRARAGRGVGEQELDVARPDFLAVDAVGRAEVALDAPRDLDRLRIVEGGRRAAIGIVEEKPDLGDVARRTPGRAGEDHVLHARAAHVLVRALAHHPAQGLDEIRLAAAVRPDDAGEARLDPELGLVAETLEAGQAQPLELHRRSPSTGEKKRNFAGLYAVFTSPGSAANRPVGRLGGLAAITESRNQPRGSRNLCESEIAAPARLRPLFAI